MIKFISLNVEGSKHMRARTLPFLVAEKPDLVCVQELLEVDIEDICTALGTHFFEFSPTSLFPEGVHAGVPQGIGIFSRLPIVTSDTYLYFGNEGALRIADNSSVQTKWKTEKHVLLTCEVVCSGYQYRFATTHFPRTPDGGVDDGQRTALANLLAVVTSEDIPILCGDFNAPRGGEIFSAIARYYKDCIPDQYKTSLDIALHRAGKERPHELENKMVVGLFMVDSYYARGVRLVSGVSDHCAIIADVVGRLRPDHTSTKRL